MWVCALGDRLLRIDGRLKGEMMMWAHMCSSCFLASGEGLGWGDGQLFARKLDGSWLLVAGFPPDDLDGDL